MGLEYSHLYRHAKSLNPLDPKFGFSEISAEGGEAGRGEPKDGSRSEPDRNKNGLTYKTGKENGILAKFGIFDE